MKILSTFLAALLLLTQISSCVSYERLVNFNQADLDTGKVEAITNTAGLEIQPEDLLRITVHAYDPLAAEPFNLEVEGRNNLQQQQLGSANSLELFMGYLVDQEGFIDFPVLGRIQIAGLTLEEAKTKLYELIQPYLKEAVINMRFLNLKITVLGEVLVPGTIRLTNKRVTILEAIGMAGDLTSYADRTNILVIREQNGQRSYGRLNLQNDEIFRSPYFYLQQNDVIYIEPLQVRTATVADPAQRIISYGSGLISIVTLILALTNRS